MCSYCLLEFDVFVILFCLNCLFLLSLFVVAFGCFVVRFPLVDFGLVALPLTIGGFIAFAVLLRWVGVG